MNMLSRKNLAEALGDGNMISWDKKFLEGDQWLFHYSCWQMSVECTIHRLNEDYFHNEDSISAHNYAGCIIENKIF